MFGILKQLSFAFKRARRTARYLYYLLNQEHGSHDKVVVEVRLHPHMMQLLSAKSEIFDLS